MKRSAVDGKVTPAVSPPAYAPCTACGVPVLVGVLGSGARLALDVTQQCFVVDWAQGTPMPRLYQSRAYPVHQCRQEKTHGHM